MPEKAGNYLPEGMHAVTVYLWFNGDCKRAIEFYKKTFGAVQTEPAMESPDGAAIFHAMLGIGDSQIMMADSMPGEWEQGPRSGSTAGLWIYVDDCDLVFERAVAAGCEVLMPLQDAFWGDRFGKVKDPFGHCWGIATHKWELTPEEMAAGQKEWLKLISGQ
ncbi:MAG: glyoxalase/bleomycin resistance/extradiol dioxygenase family protein [Syntrophobacteraceae bacterium]|nr:glyoxalase/bleomycin resistance/extradiol dioxygenase family protein [Syntrophobacteraceae bacterium]NTV43361.1 glyoxalase/bleomycin resistance/extradiol dioxygenase family protein [Syntrophobacteraceae bacterium]